MTELYVFQHFILGCMEPWCNFVFTKEEIKSPKIQKYIRIHKFHSSKINVYKFEEKKWTIESQFTKPLLDVRKITSSLFL